MIQPRAGTETTFILAAAFDREAQALGISPPSLLNQLMEVGYMQQGREKVDHALNSVPRIGMLPSVGLRSKCYCFTTPCLTADDTAQATTTMVASNVIPVSFGRQK